MDDKQLTDTIAIIQGDINSLYDMHSSDFTYFSGWMQEIDKKMRTVEATALKAEKSVQLIDILKGGVQTSNHFSNRNLAIAGGVVFVGGILVGYKLSKSKKGSKNA